MPQDEQDFGHFCVVRQEHLNQYGSLFGGYLLQIIDELAFVACVRLFPGHHFVTRALQDVEFRAPARLGDVLETRARLARRGHTSCQVQVQVFICPARGEPRRLSFDGRVVLVSVDEEGRPAPIRTAPPGACGAEEDAVC
jgi:acyl-CoA hydrolase